MGASKDPQQAREGRGIASAQLPGLSSGTDISFQRRRSDRRGGDPLALQPLAEVRQHPELQLARLGRIPVVVQALCVGLQVGSQRATREDVERPGISTAIEEMVKWDLHVPASGRDMVLGYAESS